MSVRRRVAADDAERLAGRPLDELSVEELLALAGVSFFTPTKEGWRGGGVVSEQILELQPQNFMALMMAGSGLGTAEFLYGFGRPEDAVLNLAIRRVEEAIRVNNKSDVSTLPIRCCCCSGGGGTPTRRQRRCARLSSTRTSTWRCGRWVRRRSFQANPRRELKVRCGLSASRPATLMCTFIADLRAMGISTRIA